MGLETPAMSISMALCAEKSCYRHSWISFLKTVDSMDYMSP